MDLCPNCGEELHEDAKICPHCGSDEETGWKIDADYYSLELPDDDYGEERPERRRRRHEPHEWIGLLLVFLSAGFLAWAGFITYAWGTLVILCFVGLSGLFYVAGTGGGGTRRRI